jgi:hypothetical protein
MDRTYWRRGMGGAGIGLLVLLLAILIILIMAFGSFGGKSYVQGIGAARKQARAVKEDIQTYGLTQLIVAVYNQNNKLPNTPEETGDAAAFRDPWGHEITFTYKKEGDRTYIVYHSDGPDGTPNTDDDIVKQDQLPI